MVTVVPVPETAPPLRRQTARLLFVEDDPVGARATIGILQRTLSGEFDLEITHVRTFPDAVTALRREPFDAVLLDLLLPGVPEDAIQDDLQALRAVRREVRAPIIVFSGLEAETLPQKALIQGAFAFVSKLAVNGELPPLLAAAFTGVVPADLRGKQDAALVSTMQQMAGVQDDLVVTIHGKTRIPINGALRELGLSRMYLALRREVLWGIVFAAVAGAIAGAIVSAVISAVLTL